ncbi:MAG: ABC transporter permease, partial [Planctomycetes bacterium]|nr:ABC transporter permease [Planctomycetota bacterium]
MVQGAAVLAWSAAQLEWTAERVGLAGASIVGAACLFYGLIVLQATLAFWIVDSLEVMNSLTYGGTYAAGYPMDIYPAFFRRFFTAVVPLACVSWYPVLGALGKDVSPLLAWTAPLAGPAFLGASLLAWRIGVRRYTSTGS